MDLSKLDLNNMFGINIDTYINKIIEGGIDYFPRIIGALFVVYIGFKLVKYFEKFIEKILVKQKVNLMLQNFITSLINILLKIMVIISAAGILGVQTSSLVAMLAAAGFAIGMALSGTLQNFAGGVMILVLKPFKIGDYIEVSGFIGTVKKINIFNTHLSTPDKKIIIIPNADISNGALTNYSYEPKRRIDLIIGVAYKENVAKVKKTLEEIAQADERVMKDEDIIVGLHDFGDSSVNFAFRFYVHTENYLKTRFDILEQVKIVFDKKKISFPFPQRDVHIFNEK